MAGGGRAMAEPAAGPGPRRPEPNDASRGLPPLAIPTPGAPQPSDTPTVPPTTQLVASVPSTPNVVRATAATPLDTPTHAASGGPQKPTAHNPVQHATPLVHFVGQIATYHAVDTPQTPSVRVEYHVELGDGWTVANGVPSGSTHAASPDAYGGPAPLNTAFDVAVAAESWQNWPRIAVKVFRHEPLVAREVFLGQGIAALPMSPGVHRVAVHCWRPNERKTKLADEILRVFTGYAPELAGFNFKRAREVLNAQTNLQLQTVGVGVVTVDVMCAHRAMAHAKLTLGRHLLTGIGADTMDAMEAAGDAGYDDRAAVLVAKQARLVSRELETESEGLRSVREGRGAMRGVGMRTSARLSASGAPSTAGSSPRRPSGGGAERRSDKLELELAAIRERRRQRDAMRRSKGV